MERPATPLLSPQQLRIVLAASVLAVAGAVLVGFSLITGGLSEVGAPSGIAFLFILPTFVLMYLDARKGQVAAIRVDVPAMLVMLAGEIIADLSGRTVLGEGGSLTSVVVPETVIFVLVYAAFLWTRVKALRLRKAPSAVTR